MPRVLSVLVISLALGLLVLLGWALVRPAAQSGAGINAQGSSARVQPRPAPDLQLQRFDDAGASWKLADQRGQIVLVNFWASWCPPCRSEAAVLAQAAGDYATRGVVFVGVNVWDEPAAARAFLDEFGIAFTNGRDETSRAAVDYGVTGIPETFVVDGRGWIVRRWIGPLTRTQLDKLLAGLTSLP